MRKLIVLVGKVMGYLVYYKRRLFGEASNNKEVKMLEDKREWDEVDITIDHLSNEEVYDAASLGKHFDHLGRCRECGGRVRELRIHLNTR